jgi:ABC-type transport system involved in multi-copper enzyme maturation permease subunit
MSHTLAPVRETGSSPVSLRRVCAAAVRSEWIKLRTVRSTIWALMLTVIFTVGLGALIMAIEVSRWDHRTLTEIKGFDPLLYSFAGLNLAQLSIGVLGVLVMTSEYSTRTIKLTFAAAPQRTLLLGAKVATFSAVVAVVGLVSCFAAFWVCQALLAPKHAGLSISDPGVLRAVLGGALHLVLIGAIAVGLGAAMRRTAGAVAVLFAVLLVVPGLVTLLPSPWNDDITRYLPNSAGAAMSAVVRFPNLLSPAAGLILLCAYTAATLTLAAVALTRRDA